MKPFSTNKINESNSELFTNKIVVNSKFCKTLLGKLLKSELPADVKFLDLTNNENDSDEFVFNEKQNILLKINIQAYLRKNKKASLKVVKIRVFGYMCTVGYDKIEVNAKTSIKRIAPVKSKYRSQGFLSNVYSAYGGIKKMVSFFGAIQDKIPSLDVIKSYIQENQVELGTIILNTSLGAFSLFNMLQGPMSSFSPLNFLSAVVQVLSGAALAFKPIYKSQSNFVGLFSNTIMSLMGVPKHIKELMLAVISFSNGSILSVYDKVLEISIFVIGYFIDLLIKLFPNNTILKTLDNLVSDYSYKYDVENMCEDIIEVLKPYYANPLILARPDFRLRVNKVLDSIKQHKNFAKAKNDPFKRNFQLLFDDLSGVSKNGGSYEATSRPVPALVIIEGPAGCGKSTIMNLVTKKYAEEGYTTYSHLWKTQMEGKDFYDDYNNQDIMVLDDIGQGGNGQWAKTMNFVSSVKLPLDCASAEKKCTKFFTSSLIIGTTNVFTKINNITKDDGIADAEALFRRPLVFDVKKSDANSFNWDITVKYYSIEPNNKGWKEDYPVAFKKYLQSRLEEYRIAHPNEKLDDEIITKVRLIGQEPAAGWIYNISTALMSFNKETHEKLDTVIDAEKAPFGFLSFKSQSQIKYDVNSDTVILPFPHEEEEDMGELDEEIGAFIDAHMQLDTKFVRFKKLVFRCLALFREIGGVILDKVLDFATEHPFLTFVIPVLVAGFAGLAIGLYKYYVSKKCISIPVTAIRNFKLQGLDFGEIDIDNNRIRAAQQTMLRLIFKGKNFQMASVGCASGKFMLTTRHSVLGATAVSVYKSEASFANKTPLMEYCPFKLVFEDPQSDLAIIELQVATTLFKKASCMFSSVDNQVKIREVVLLTPSGVHPINSTHIRENTEALKVMSIEYGKEKEKQFDPNTGLFYEYTQDGLCGSIMFDRNRGMIGVHVAGCDTEGFVSVPSMEVRNKISQIMLSVVDPIFDVEEIKNGAGMRIRYPPGAVKPVIPLKQSSLLPTGAPVLESVARRVPSTFVKEDGSSKVKDIGLENFKPSAYIDEELVDFAVKVTSKAYDKYSTLTWKEVVKGNPEKGIPPLNKKSVSGYGYGKDKTEYIDFVTGDIDPSYLKELENFGEELLRGEIPYDKMICYHALKDELRPIGKEPRTFSVLPLHFTLWTKKLFGELASIVRKGRHSNGIALGVNPYAEWTTVWNNLTSNRKYVFDGDVKGWDKSLVIQLLERGSKTMASFNTNEADRTRAYNLMNATLRIFVLLKDELYVPTHGMQSGCWLTAFLNSVVNKMISACCFKKNYKGKKPEFDFARIVEYFLGDDRISGVPRDLIEDYNMLTLDSFFKEIGMQLTDGKKQQITKQYMDPSEISFLKRKFVVGEIDVSAIFGPLSKETLGNLFSYVDCSKDYEQVMCDRSVVFQIEKYLHKNDPDLIDYQSCLEDYYSKQGLVWKHMTQEHIRQILTSPEGYVEMMNTIGKYDGTF